MSPLTELVGKAKFEQRKRTETLKIVRYNLEIV